MKKTKKIVIEIEKPEEVSHNLSDLLCWWEGFKTGIQINNEFPQSFVAQNGINAARELNIAIKDKLNKL
jgi:hypothetical protein